MVHPHFLLHLAIILILSKYVAALSIKFKMPPVLGMIITGILLGPSVLDIVKTDIVLQWLAKLGVILLLFTAGLDTDIAQMKSQGKASLMTAAGGVLVPFALGFFTSRFFGLDVFSSTLIGTVLMATSVSVTVMTLIDLKKLHSSEGTTILGAAIIDDVIGILMLTFVFGLHGGENNILISMAKILGYFVASFLVGFFLFKPIIRFTRKLEVESGVVAVALSLCFLFAWAAEKAGMAEITGAYIAGLFVGQTRSKRTVSEGVETLGQSFFVAIFFINIGLETQLRDISGNPGFIIFIILFAIAGKILGSGVGAKIGGFSLRQSTRIGVGMVPRGEVALIISAMALTRGIFTQTEYSTTVLIVILSAIITPPLLKWAFKEKDDV
ncbi:MAG: cation:proton antiporter [Spirochaetes bacterium]|nr:MAG: cation:proton antiporter [Spirochaetota bacterium]RKX97824.1 MAG: cation:proton antiporter [Spirochaetota bacterium]